MLSGRNSRTLFIIACILWMSQLQVVFIETRQITLQHPYIEGEMSLFMQVDVNENFFGKQREGNLRLSKYLAMCKRIALLIWAHFGFEANEKRQI